MSAAPGQWRPNLLLAALHELVLQHPDHLLARWYPTVGGDPLADGDLLASVHSMIDAHAGAFGAMMRTRSTQTNEVNRTTLFRPVLGAVLGDVDNAIDRGIAWVEIGASAGLNLAFDDYHLVYGGLGRHAGVDHSPVRLLCEVRGDLTAAGVALDRGLELPVVARVGLDVAPVDLAVDGERRWLKACIWPEQLERHERFDAAADHTVELAAAGTLHLIADDAVDGVSDAIDFAVDLAADHGYDDPIVVVVNTWVMTYLSKDRRQAFANVLDLVGSTRDLVHVSAEAEGVVGWVPTNDTTSVDTVVGVRTWFDGVRTETRLATCHPHLAWLDWPAEAP